jgi:nitrogen fixation/metabolism regulation signal transduction histidine kinase
MRILGRTERRVVSAILVTALIPLVAAILIARAVIQRVSAAAFQPEFSAHLHQSLGVYRELAAAIKQGMRYEADAIAASPALVSGAEKRDTAALSAELASLFKAHPALVSIDLATCDGRPLARRDRGRPVDTERERTLRVERAVGGAAAGSQGEEAACDPAAPVPLTLVATFATPSDRFLELESIQDFTKAYDEFAQSHREQYLDRTYRNVFAVLLGLTIVLAVAAGIFVARPVTKGIARLAAATRPVAEGDLSVRVAEEGDDEVADLGRAFNRMLGELEQSRARVEFLRRMSEWQKMARRLAHEIKNPLTPIQLAVEECHRRYSGDDAAYRRILETTLEVVAEEVSSLRRLVGEFSSFARLPRAELAPGDLGDFLRAERAHFDVSGFAEEGEGGDLASPDEGGAAARGIAVSFNVPDAPMPAVFDREMLHRALANILRNAAQAIRGSDAKAVKAAKAVESARAGKASGVVRVSAEVSSARFTIDIDDDGPGIQGDLLGTIFDPYVTSKRDGTGLGLSIVKKIIVDHGGTIDAGPSPLGGARFRIRLPRAGTAEAQAALDRAAAAS